MNGMIDKEVTQRELLLIVVLVVTERYDRQLLRNAYTFCNGGVGHVKTPQLRNLPGYLPVE